MITLYAFGPIWGLPDPSPFVMKTHIQLQMARLDHRVLGAKPPEGPKGKLPFIEDGGAKIGDSVFIRDHIERTYGVDLDAALTPEQRAVAWFIERTLEDHLYWAVVYGRWAVDENFDKGPAVFFTGAPPEVREAGRARMLTTLHGQGFGRHGVDEVADLAGRSFAALSRQIGDGPYLFGEQISGTDASAFAFIASLATPHFDTPIRDALMDFPNLLAYRDRMMARFFPEMAPAMA